ncbi:unnamed protein product, partial [Durusdinium trenchii]
MKRVQDVEDISLDLKWEGSPSGTMTDACKRLREEKKSTGPEMASYVASSVGATMPIPMPVSPEQAQSPYPQGNLPPGVTSISQWGSSLVAFGKYKGVKTYEEMRDPNDPDLASYRSYCVIEHLKESDYQVKGGDKVIFHLLDKRWPELDRTDEIGETIAAVFALKATEGESVRQWRARSRETFDRCARKTGVKFPEEARGWILLNCSGLQAEQRAVVLARAQGDLKFDQVSQSMRSCFPDYVVPKKRAVEHEVLLVSSPGFAVLDSGCGKTIIGRDTLNSFKDIWQRHGIAPRPEKAERNSFRYGNGEQEMSETVVDMPVFLAGRPGYVTAAVVKGRAPLLLSRPALKKLQAQVDFSGDTLQVNAAGQYAIKVSDFPSQAQTMFPPLAHDEQ